jgi:hypothetical protein
MTDKPQQTDEERLGLPAEPFTDRIPARVMASYCDEILKWGAAWKEKALELEQLLDAKKIELESTGRLLDKVINELISDGAEPTRTIKL